MGALKGTSDTITVHIKAQISGDLGKVTKLQFKATYNRRTVEDTDAIIQAMNDPDDDTNVASIVRDDLVRWEGLQGDGGEVDFNDENLEAALSHFEYLGALMDGWTQAQMGRSMALAKN